MLVPNPAFDAPGFAAPSFLPDSALAEASADFATFLLGEIAIDAASGFAAFVVFVAAFLVW